MGDIRVLQEKCVTPWLVANGFDVGPELAALGLAEEVGEVCRAVLKQSQGVRGTHEHWQDEIKKELGDVVIKCADVARACGIDLSDAVWQRWYDVESTHDWRRAYAHREE